MPSTRTSFCLTVYALLAGLTGVAAFAVAPCAALAAPKGDDDALAAFKEAFASEDAAKRAEAVTSLAQVSDAAKFEAITKIVLPDEKRADVVARAVDVLSRVTDADVIGEIVKEAQRGKLDRRLVHVEVLSSFDKSPPAHQALLGLLEDREAFVRGIAAYGLGRHRDIDALEPLMKALAKEGAWQVQAAIFSALPRLDGREALLAKVPALVEHMEGSSGRLKDDIGVALGRITGKNYGNDEKKWRAHVDGRDTPKETDGDSTGGSASTGGYGNQPAKPHFYGIDVTSNRIVILLDVSLSMNEAISFDLDRLKRETSRRRAITGGGDDKKEPDGKPQEFDIPWWRVKTNLDLARFQTINLIESLRDDQYFELILFSTKVNPWMGKLVPATSANKLKAQRLLETLKPEEKTNTWGAFAKAFDLYDSDAKSYTRGPDEVYLVTDGAPSVGDIVDLQQIEDAVMQLWQVKQIRINVIGIGVNLRGLRRIATRTGGICKFFN